MNLATYLKGTAENFYFSLIWPCGQCIWASSCRDELDLARTNECFVCRMHNNELIHLFLAMGRKLDKTYVY